MFSVIAKEVFFSIGKEVGRRVLSHGLRIGVSYLTHQVSKSFGFDITDLGNHAFRLANEYLFSSTTGNLIASNDISTDIRNSKYLKRRATKSTEESLKSILDNLGIKISEKDYKQFKYDIIDYACQSGDHEFKIFTDKLKPLNIHQIKNLIETKWEHQLYSVEHYFANNPDNLPHIEQSTVLMPAEIPLAKIYINDHLGIETDPEEVKRLKAQVDWDLLRKQKNAFAESQKVKDKLVVHPKYFTSPAEWEALGCGHLDMVHTLREEQKDIEELLSNYIYMQLAFQGDYKTLCKFKQDGVSDREVIKRVQFVTKAVYNVYPEEKAKKITYPSKQDFSDFFELKESVDYISSDISDYHLPELKPATFDDAMASLQMRVNSDIKYRKYIKRPPIIDLFRHQKFFEDKFLPT